ncbi:619_t:CDS:2 [Ambispora gerdemannii]|uniref:619_t:CDS:1 n=1 Tax=Ambispora gerdemannii TaxID=144530 RepID=A0A9N9CSF7_9GLOM|nr:619_t:CDS:2 [Ambispora gerdemannii]
MNSNWRKPRLDHITTDELRLWKVNIPINDKDLENAENIKSCPFKTAGGYFHESSQDIHIIVKPPATTDEDMILDLINNSPTINLPQTDEGTTIYNRKGSDKAYFGKLMLVELFKQNKQVLMNYKGFIDPKDKN